MSNEFENNIVLLSGLITDNFDVFELSNEFWVKTKVSSDLPDMCCKLDSYRFSCWLKWFCQETLDKRVSEQTISEVREFVIGRSVEIWSQSSPITTEIEKHLVVHALIAWFENWQSKRDGERHQRIYQSRFETFYKELKEFTDRNFTRRAITEFPRSSNVLSRRLKELTPIINKAGLLVSMVARDRRGRRVAVSAVCDDSLGVASPIVGEENTSDLGGSVSNDDGDDLKRKTGEVLQEGEVE